MSGLENHLRRLEQLRRETDAQRQAIVARAEAAGQEFLDEKATAEFRELTDSVAELDERIQHLRGEIQRSGRNDPDSAKVRRATALNGGAGSAAQWAQTAARELRANLGGRGTESRAVVSGSIDVPSLVLPEVVPIPRPVRLIDLFSNREGIDSVAFEYFKATQRTNNATVVPDLGTKPTSVNTVQAVTDRARVIAHLSEPVPYRIFASENEVASWLNNEMVQGVYDALEAEVIGSPTGAGPGSGSGEHMTGILKETQTTAVPFNTDVPTTLRSAVTALQNIGITPNGWALNPADAQAIDLLRWGSQGGLLTGGYEQTGLMGQATLADNIFGPTRPRVVSPSVPQGTAILAKWDDLKLFVYWSMQLMVNAFSDTLFATNAVQVRAESIVGVGILQPRSFAIVNLTSS